MVYLASLHAVAVAAALGASLLCAFPARAHQAPTGWAYPRACGADRDCWEGRSSALGERPRGYVIPWTDEVVAYEGRTVRQSPDGEYHSCAHEAGVDAGQTVCLFVLPKEF